MAIDPIKLYAREIRARVSDAELLAGAAEECMELAHALLKERRAIMQGENPTPVNPSTAYEKVVEELSDVALYMQVLGFVPDGKVQLHKMNRWIERLNEREGAE